MSQEEDYLSHRKLPPDEWRPNPQMMQMTPVDLFASEHTAQILAVTLPGAWPLEEILAAASWPRGQLQLQLFCHLFLVTLLV